MTARLISAFSSQWEALRSNEFRRTTEVVAKHINLLGMCGSNKLWMVGVPCWKDVSCALSLLPYALPPHPKDNTHTHTPPHQPTDQTGVCEAEPEGVLSPLVTFNVPSFVFGIEPIQVIDD